VFTVCTVCRKTETQISCKNRNTDKAKESLLRSKGCWTAERTQPVVVGAEIVVVGGFEENRRDLLWL
jgi:hypothetical protein